MAGRSPERGRQGLEHKLRDCFVALALGLAWTLLTGLGGTAQVAEDRSGAAYRELTDARAAGRAMAPKRLLEVYSTFAQEEYASPGRAPLGLEWSTCFRELAAACAGRDGLEDLQLAALQIQAACLNRAAQQADAVRVLREAIAAHPARLYSVAPRVDLGTYLRAQHEFEGALVELRQAQQLIETLAASGVDSDYLRTQEAINCSELGAVRAALGMTADARANFERVEQLSPAIGEADGPVVWGANLVYQLNLANSRQRQGEVAALRERYEAHRWRDRVPGETRMQIEMRFAISRTMEAFRGLKEAGSGEAELRELIGEQMKFEEDLRARIFLAQSLLDRGALDAAEVELDLARERLAERSGMQLPRLHLVGLHALLLRKQGARLEERRVLLEEELAPAIDRFLERAKRGPLERAGVSHLLYDWARAALSELIELELGLESRGLGEQNAFEWILKLQAAGSFAREQGLLRPSLETIRDELLGAGSGLLVYVPGRVQSHVFAVTADELTVVRLQPAWRLDRCARDLEEELQASLMARSDASDARLEQRLREGSQSFLPPELRALVVSWKTIHVVGLDDFGYVPFEALTGANGEPTGRSQAIYVQPSVAIGVWLTRRARELGRFDGPALFVLGEGSPALGGRAELAALDLDPQALGAEGLQEHGLQFEVLAPAGPNDLRAKLANSPMAVFLLHGLYDADRARPAGLLIAPGSVDGAWFSDRIEQLASPPFALLAACGGDRAQERRGDDGQGHLRAAFFRGGAASVATSTLALESRATQQFVSLVNERLARGESVGEAFLSARRNAAPQNFSMHPIHSYLLRVYGAGDLRPFAAPITVSKRGPEHNEGGRRTLLLVVLAALGAGLSAGVLLRSRARASSEDHQSEE